MSHTICAMKGLELPPYLHSVAVANFQILCQDLQGDVGCCYGGKHLLGQLPWGINSFRPAVSVPRVFDVIPCRAKDEVSWVAARRIVADMPHHGLGVFCRLLNRAVFQFVRENMGRSGFSVYPKRAVSKIALTSRPKPALVRATFSHLRQESFSGVKPFSIPTSKADTFHRAIFCCFSVSLKDHFRRAADKTSNFHFLRHGLTPLVDRPILPRGRQW